LRKFATLVALFCSTAFAEGPATQFARQYLEPLLKSREGRYQLQVNGNKIVLQSGAKFQSVGFQALGKYEFDFSDAVTEIPSGAPALFKERVLFQGIPGLRLSGTVHLPLNPQGDVPSLLRRLFRADPILTPMTLRPGQRAELSEPQQDILRQLIKYRRNALDIGVATRAMVIGPTGIGKTIIAGEFAREIINEDPTKPYTIYFVVQNLEILTDARKKFNDMFNFKPHESRYGSGKGNFVAPGEAKFVTISRSSLMDNLQELTEKRRKFKGNVIYFFDEAHHLGKMDGEFDKIVHAIGSGAGPQDIMVGLSPTPWHTENDVFRKDFHDHVATTFLDEQEQDDLLHSRKLMEMSRRLMFRAMDKGYLSPIHSYKQIDYIQGENEKIWARSFLNDWEIKLKETPEPDQMETLKKDIIAHLPLVRKMMAEILATEQRDPKDGKPLTWNRGLIFVPTIAHAEIYSFLLNMIAQDTHKPVFAKAYHSELGQSKRQNVMSWFQDEDAKSGSWDETSSSQKQSTNKNIHKYLFVIRTVSEGFDYPNLNHLILAKPYGEGDEAGVRELIQNLGRALRLAYGKDKIFLTDFTGDMRRLIFKYLDESLIKEFFTSNSEKDFRDLPRSAPSIKTETVVDTLSLKLANFKTLDVEVPVQQLAQQKPANPVAAAIDATVASVASPVEETSAFFAPMSWKDFADRPGSAALFLHDSKESLREELVEMKMSLREALELTAKPFEKTPKVDAGLYYALQDRLLRTGFTLGVIPDGMSWFTPAHFLYLNGDISKIKKWALVDPAGRTYGWKIRQFLKENPIQKLPTTLIHNDDRTRLYKAYTWQDFFRQPGSLQILFGDAPLPKSRSLSMELWTVAQLMTESKDAAEKNALKDSEYQKLTELLQSVGLRTYENGGREQFESPELKQFSPFTMAHRLLRRDNGETIRSIVTSEWRENAHYNYRAVLDKYAPFLSGLDPSDSAWLTEINLFLEDHPLDHSRAQRLLRKVLGVSEPIQQITDKFFSPLTWQEFVDRPGSAVLYLQDIEMPIRSILFNTRLKLRDLLMSDEDALKDFSAEQIEKMHTALKSHGLKLGLVPSGLSTYTPAYFVMLHVKPERLQTWELDPKDIVKPTYVLSTSDVRLLNENVVPEAPKNLVLTELVTFLNGHPPSRKASYNTGFYEYLTWKDFADRPGSALLFFHKLDVTSRLKLLESRRSLRDVIDSFAGKVFQQKQQIDVKSILEEYGFAEGKIPDGVSPFAPAHFLYLKTRPDRLMNWDLNYADISVGGSLNVSLDLFPEAMNGTPVADLKSFLETHAFHKEVQEAFPSDTRKYLFEPRTWAEFLHETESFALLLDDDIFKSSKIRHDSGVSIARYMQMNKSKFIHDTLGMGATFYEKIAIALEPLGIKNGNNGGKEQIEMSALGQPSPYSLAHLLLQTYGYGGGRSVLEEMNALWQQRKFSELSRLIDTRARFLGKVTLEDSSWLKEINEFVQNHPIDRAANRQTLQRILEGAPYDTYFYRPLSWREFIRREGSAALFFHDVDVSIRKKLLASKLRLSDFIDHSPAIHALTPDEGDTLYKVLNRYSIPSPDTDIHITPAHFALLKTRPERLEHWDLDVADISLAGDLNLAIGGAPNGTPVSLLMDFLHSHPLRFFAGVDKFLTWEEFLTSKGSVIALMKSGVSPNLLRRIHEHELNVMDVLKRDFSSKALIPPTTVLGDTSIAAIQKRFNELGLPLSGSVEFKPEFLKSESPFMILNLMRGIVSDASDEALKEAFKNGLKPRPELPTMTWEQFLKSPVSAVMAIGNRIDPRILARIARERNSLEDFFYDREQLSVKDSNEVHPVLRKLGLEFGHDQYSFDRKFLESPCPFTPDEIQSVAAVAQTITKQMNQRDWGIAVRSLKNALTAIGERNIEIPKEVKHETGTSMTDPLIWSEFIKRYGSAALYFHFNTNHHKELQLLAESKLSIEEVFNSIPIEIRGVGLHERMELAKILRENGIDPNGSTANSPYSPSHFILLAAQKEDPQFPLKHIYTFNTKDVDFDLARSYSFRMIPELPINDREWIERSISFTENHPPATTSAVQPAPIAQPPAVGRLQTLTWGEFLDMPESIPLILGKEFSASFINRAYRENVKLKTLLDMPVEEWRRGLERSLEIRERTVVAIRQRLNQLGIKTRSKLEPDVVQFDNELLRSATPFSRDSVFEFGEKLLTGSRSPYFRIAQIAAFDNFSVSDDIIRSSLNSRTIVETEGPTLHFVRWRDVLASPGSLLLFVREAHASQKTIDAIAKLNMSLSEALRKSEHEWAQVPGMIHILPAVHARLKNLGIEMETEFSVIREDREFQAFLETQSPYTVEDLRDPLHATVVEDDVLKQQFGKCEVWLTGK